MDIEDDGLEEEKTIKTAVGIEDQLDLYKDRMVLRKKGLSNSVKSSNKVFKLKDIVSIIIKPAGTLYPGKAELTASNGVRYSVDFNSYQQQDFQDIKVILGK